MHHSQQVALRHSLFGAQPARAPGGPLQQTVLLPRKRPHAGGDRLLSGGAEERGAACGGTSGAANSPADESASPYLILRVRRSHLVEDSLGALALATPLELLKPVRVVFEGEPAIDEGGVRKEFFQLLVEALLGGDYGLFEWNEEARCFWFSRDCLVQDSGADFLLVGLAVGLAIHNGLILDLKFPTLLYSRLLGNEAGLRELKQVGGREGLGRHCRRRRAPPHRRASFRHHPAPERPLSAGARPTASTPASLPPGSGPARAVARAEPTALLRGRRRGDLLRRLHGGHHRIRGAGHRRAGAGGQRRAPLFSPVCLAARPSWVLCRGDRVGGRCAQLRSPTHAPRLVRSR